MNEIDILLIRLKNSANVGSIYRLALQYGVKNIYNYNSVQPGCTDTSKAGRHIPIHKIETLDFLATYEYPKYLLETNGTDIRKYKTDIPTRFLIAIANESLGATKDEADLFNQVITIPAPNLEFHEQMISYNVSNALAIGLFYLEYRIHEN